MSSLWFWADPSKLHSIAVKLQYMPLQNWGISSRTLNALLRYNFKMSVGNVMYADENFATIWGLGIAGLEELKVKIAQTLTEEYENVNRDLPTKQDFPLSSKALPETIQNVPLSYLHLDLKTHDVLIQSGITTIVQLYAASSTFVGDIKGFHSNSLACINKSLLTLLNSLKNEIDIDWLQYWKSQMIQVLPLIEGSNTSSEEILIQLPSVIEEVLRQELDEKACIIIKRRFGLGNVEKLTLEDIGDAYGLSKERVRQIEEKALKILKYVFRDKSYTGKNYQIHPEIYKMIQKLLDIIEIEQSKVILENKLLACVQQSFKIDVQKIKSSLFLVLELIGMEHIEFDYQDAISAWGYADPVKRRILESGVKRLDDFLTRVTSLPHTEFDILAQINKGVKKADKVTLAYLSWLITLCISVEKREDGSIWGRFEHLKGRGNQAERLLIEAGKPLSVAYMAREMNHRLVPLNRRSINEAYLTNQLVSDSRFVPIGRSGTWKLKSWDHVDTKSILILMEQYLIALNKPATVNDIYTYVSERRNVNKNSIVMYLGTEKERFIRVGSNMWGLATWSDMTTSSIWDMVEVADFVAALFKKHKTKELPYKTIKEALMEEAEVSASKAQGLLNINPVIKTHKGKKWNELIAVFQPNYKEMLAQPQTFYPIHRESLRPKVEAEAHKILDTVPDKQMPMAELVQVLQKKFNYSETTLYSYIGQIDSIERLDIPDSNKKMCRAKEFNGVVTGGNLRERISKSVRVILETMPDKQMPLASLIVLLQKEYNCPKPTLYQYIAHLDYIERINIPNSTARLCRIKDMQGKLLFQQVKNIATTKLRENVQSAISDLDVERVDIGLFRLGREFETTLKAYLMAAYKKGKLISTPGNKNPDQLKLVEMITCLKNNDIVTDEAALSYLRQQRNDRAHGSTPTLEERRILMNNVQQLASLYIDYIKLFDDLLQKI